ncbi:MAG: SpoIIE family protein phosphatase [Crocinitomicaceae bacterium]|nr:SpoIIE family protein phosphatase [Crocinitomicaceae bacterium]
MIRVNNILLLIIGLIPYLSHSQEELEYPEDMMEGLTACRECLLSKPDSCVDIVKPVIEEANKRELYHIPAKIALMQGIGYAYSNDLTNAIILFKRAAEIASHLVPNEIHVNALNNTANMYLSQGDSLMARKYFEEGLDAAKATEQKEMILGTKIQILSLILTNPDSTFHSLIDEVESEEEFLTENSRAYFYLIRSDYEIDQENYQKALEYALLSNELYNDQDRIGLVSTTQNIGLSYIGLGYPKKALPYCHEGLDVALEDDMGLWKSMNCKCLWQAYKSIGQSDKALFYLEQMNEFNEAVKNDDRIRELTALELETEYEKTRITDSLSNVQASLIQEKENELAVDKERTKSQALIIGLIALGVILFLMVRQVRNKKKVNETMREQRDAIELRQTEIVDSIKYAKRLQDAILPSSERFENADISAFVLYKPKDVVSGDFYWMHERLDENGDELIYIAVGDCTGHGVPGAMVSVVCSTALEHAVKSINNLNTGRLLDETNGLVQETFKTQKDNVTDGMDISLVGYNRSKNIFQFSGANNGIYIKRENGLEEIKGTRQPIGVYHYQKPFESIDFKLSSKEIVFITTDGFIDQFGSLEKDDNKEGRKFKKKSFKVLLEDVAQLRFKDQRNKLESTHNSWKGDFEQTDDICIMGLQFKG